MRCTPKSNGEQSTSRHPTIGCAMKLNGSLAANVLRLLLPCMLISCIGLPSWDLHSISNAQDQPIRLAWQLESTGSKASLRGLHAASDSVIWACGSESTVIRSTDGGRSWIPCGPKIPDHADLEYRSIHAWDEMSACIASAGTPAMILRTADGGQNWEEVFQHASPQAFFDGLRFWDAAHGIAFSDPVDGKFLIVETSDGGQTWQAVDADLLPEALAGEAGFAASNSSLALAPGGHAWIGTGGAIAGKSRIYSRFGWNNQWQIADCPIESNASSGIFSIVADAEKLIAVGGDYRPDAVSAETAAYSLDQGKSWSLAQKQPAAFRSAVAHLPSSIAKGFIATGPTGSDFSIDGQSWDAFSEQGFHTLAVSPKKLFAAGAGGRFAVLTIAAPQ